MSCFVHIFSACVQTRQLLDGIVSRGVDVNVREKQTLSGPLHLAAERNFVHVARLLLDNEAVTQSEGNIISHVLILLFVLITLT